MRLYTLFISYSHGTHYCGVYTSPEYLHGVICEMARDCDIPKREIPKLSLIEKTLEESSEDFWHEFGDGTWIQVQETSAELVKIIHEVMEEIGCQNHS